MDAEAGAPIHAAVAAWGRRTPTAVAIVHDGRPTSYAELNARAGAYAAALCAAGVGPGAIVPVVLPRGAELAAVLLAVLRCGAAYAALDRRWPDARLRAVTEALAPPLVIGADTGPPRWDPPRRPVPGASLAYASPAAPAAVFFTSGSSGSPKGVLSPHRGTTRLLRGAVFAPGRVVAQTAPVPWDAFGFELWGPLCTGGTTVIVDGDHLMPDELRRRITVDGVDTVFLTTSLFNLFTEEDPGCFTGLRQVLTGGETASPHTFGAFLSAHPDIALFNCYGPVESTVFATAHRASPSDCVRPDGVPVGAPVPDTGVHVFAGNTELPRGETGEICLTGGGLAAGYLGDPVATERSFPTLTVNGRPVRAYRTGDHGFLDEHGVLHFRGRRDRQVKVAGHRIEPAEVENAARALPGVRDCAAVPMPSPGGGYRALALCYLAGDGGPEPGDVRRALGELLPRHLVPGVVRRAGRFPVGATGKLDRAGLLALLEDAP